jgi:hypothetical protein
LLLRVLLALPSSQMLLPSSLLVLLALPSCQVLQPFLLLVVVLLLPSFQV